MTGIGSTKSKPISISSGEAEQVHVAFGLPVAFWSASFMLNCGSASSWTSSASVFTCERGERVGELRLEDFMIHACLHHQFDQISSQVQHLILQETETQWD